MENRWSAEDVNDLDELDLLVYQSRLIGEEPSLVLWGGGNTSLKVTRADFRGRQVTAMLVKGSGSGMKSAMRRDFPALRMDDVLPLFELPQMSDDGMVEYLSHCVMDPGSPRPSIETLLHGFLPQNSCCPHARGRHSLPDQHAQRIQDNARCWRRSSARMS